MRPSGATAADVRVAMYDQERWEHTPPSEQRDPVAAITRFGELAHRHSHRVIVTPHPGLVSVKGGALTREANETETAERARRVNPQVLVLSGLSTSPGGARTELTTIP
jgi:hypothetical protein